MKKLLISIALLFLIGCSVSQPPKTYNVVKEMTFEKSYDRIWNTAIEWFAIQGTPIKNMDKSSGFISTEYSLSANRGGCLDCGTMGDALLTYSRMEDPRGNFNLLIKKITDTKTKVTVNCFFKITGNVYMSGRLQSSRVIDCASTGILEKEILDYLGNQ